MLIWNKNMSYLLDTNVLSEFARTQPNKNVLAWLEAVPEEALFLSVLSIGEIRKGIENLTDKTRKEKLRLSLEHNLTNRFKGRILTIDRHIAERWGELLGKSKRPLPAIDSLLAATALHHELRLVTRNMKDFQDIDIELINPWRS